jgi:nucleoside-diphosphate-sugar epimerase
MTVLVTGAAGFIGLRVVERLVEHGLVSIRCLVRSPSGCSGLNKLKEQCSGRADIEVKTGNLLSRRDCEDAVRGVSIIYHLAAGRGEKLVADAFMNSVVTTRNLLEACHKACTVRRFVNISSFSVYTNRHKTRQRLLDERCQI